MFFCKDCIHILFADSVNPKCARTESIDLVTGEAVHEACALQRALQVTSACGKAGQHFFQKPAEKPSPAVKTASIPLPNKRGSK